LIGYFYSQEFHKNWASLQNFKPVINMGYLMISLALFLLSYLLETYIWKVCINKHLGRHELNFSQSIAVVNASGLLKYLPGRIWTYTAQFVWLKKYNIPKSLILYVGLICTLGSIIVSLYLGLIYLAFYTNVMSLNLTILSFTVLILFNILYIIWNSYLINKLIALARRLFKKEIQPLNSSRSLIFYIQLVYMGSWFLAGFSGYFLAEGIGLNVPYSHMFAILASMSLSWVIGYVTIITPGGLGVREGMMLVMLNNIVNTQTALIFPILSRLMYLIAEALLGLLALFFGIKYDVFSSKKADQVE
jgi:uncharacterized membrane protein YbhN (UPF0104 family)